MHTRACYRLKERDSTQTREYTHDSVHYFARQSRTTLTLVDHVQDGIGDKHHQHGNCTSILRSNVFYVRRTVAFSAKLPCTSPEPSIINVRKRRTSRDDKRWQSAILLPLPQARGPTQTRRLLGATRTSRSRQRRQRIKQRYTPYARTSAIEIRDVIADALPQYAQKLQDLNMERGVFVKFDRAATQSDIKTLRELLPGLGLMYTRGNSVLVEIRIDTEHETV